MTGHPARFSDDLMPVFQTLINRYRWQRDVGRPRLLDPFAGTGRVHELQNCSTVGIEIEPEWAALSFKTIEGDATDLPAPWTDHFDIVLTSPTYGNRMADHHEARDTSKRITYRHKLGRKLHPNNTGGMQWGDDYRMMHKLAWQEVLRVIKPGGWFILNIRNHIRKGALVEVSAWHRRVLEELGFKCIDVIHVKTPGMRFGANRLLRTTGEYVFVFTAPDPKADS